MSPENFSFYQKFLHEKSGLSINEEKIYLLESRLSHLAQTNGYTSLDHLANELKQRPSSQLARETVFAMTTNETLFFRDGRPFKLLREEALPRLLSARQTKKSLRIWSAACSTGQEPYSVAITLAEMLENLNAWRIEILATDLAEHALAQGRRGEYSQFEVQRGMPTQLLIKYFQQNDTNWKVNDSIRNMVKYESFNLLNSMEAMGSFDIIFCRNVLIYFDEETKKKILANLARRLQPDGFLFLGGSETVFRLCTDLKAHESYPGLYTRSDFVENKVIPAPAKFSASPPPQMCLQRNQRNGI